MKRFILDIFSHFINPEIETWRTSVSTLASIVVLISFSWVLTITFFFTFNSIFSGYSLSTINPDIGSNQELIDGDTLFIHNLVAGDLIFGNQEYDTISVITITEKNNESLELGSSGKVETFFFYKKEFSPITIKSTFEINSNISYESVDEVLDEIIKSSGKERNIPLSSKQREWFRFNIKSHLNEIVLEDFRSNISLIRLVNGSIQFYTIWLLNTLLVLLISRYVIRVYREQRLYAILTNKTNHNFQEIKNLSSKIESPNNLNSFVDNAIGEDKVDLYRWNKENSCLYDIILTTLGWKVRKVDHTQIPQFISGVASNHRREIDNFYSIPRYINWSIPLIGFIGTIVGIQDSMAAAGGINNPDIMQSIVSNSKVTGSISVAFGTTLVALVCSLIGNFFISYVQKREETLLNFSEKIGFDLGAISAEELNILELEKQKERNAKELAQLEELDLNASVKFEETESNIIRHLAEIDLLQGRIKFLNKTKANLETYRERIKSKKKVLGKSE